MAAALTPGVAPFGQTSTGEAVHRITIADGALSAAILTLGVALQDVRLDGTAHSLTVGGPTLAPYEAEMQFCGTIVGPVANRIGGARAVIDGQTYRFDANLNGKHTLHGGSGATHNRVWTLADHGPVHATFHLHLKKGDGGFPGDRHLSARYRIANRALELTLSASTDAPTLMNLANHSYWRLDDAPTFAGQTLKIDAESYLPSTPDDVLPTGEIAPVTGSRFDFRRPRRLGAGNEGLIDTNFCLSQTRQPLRPVAWLTGRSGLTLEMATTEPGLQVFDGHILDMPVCPGNDGPPHRAYSGLALEPQFWPDATNNPNFPSIILRPGETWTQTTTWRFSQRQPQVDPLN